jgi:hypothetical protein
VVEVNTKEVDNLARWGFQQHGSANFISREWDIQGRIIKKLYKFENFRMEWVDGGE